jgi:hypothetical protein
MSTVLAGSSVATSVDYRYILTDTLTDNVLAEIPFVDVSYSTAVNEAGSFSGSFPITAETSVQDVYQNTLPGKTSLYILRNSICVWGGIISNRSYNVKDKTLEVTADEFLSYLDRRVVWKTWSTEYSCNINIVEDPNIPGRIIGKVVLVGDNTHQEFDLVPGKSKVWLYFGPELADYANQYTILKDPIYKVDTVGYKHFYFAGFYRPGTSVNFRPMKTRLIMSDTASVRFRQDTDDFLNTLLTEHFADDLKDLTFANEFVAPGETRRLDISTYSRSSNVVTLTTEDPHYLVPGQYIAIKNLSTFNTPNAEVLSTPTEKTFTYAKSGANSPTVSVTSFLVAVERFARFSDVVTITTKTNHGFAVGDIVKVDGVDDRIDADFLYVITRIGTSANPGNLKQFQFSSSGDKINNSIVAAGVSIERNPILELNTGGSYTNNSDIGIKFTTPETLTTVQAFQDPIRGAEAFTFKEVIDKYSSDLIGFDYRIDCTFDKATNKFSKNFKFLPLVPESLESVINNAGGVLPSSMLPLIEYFSVEGRKAADLSFEFPGNISSVQMVESLEEGANRVFAQGGTDVDAPPPYAAAVDYRFLKDGWPLFDKVIKKDKVFYSRDLYQIANKVMSQAQLPVATFSITVNGTANPELGSYKPGDWCTVYVDDPFVIARLNSYYENKGDTSRNVLLRKISKISVTLAANPALPEEAILELVTEPGVDIVGEERAWR